MIIEPNITPNVCITIEKPDLFWAVIEHVKTWLGEDGIFLARVSENGGRLDGTTLRRIAVAYCVSRGIPGTKGNGDDHADALADLLNSRLKEWASEKDSGGLSSTLVERANMCAEIAKKAKEDGHTSGTQVSAITKIVWFAKPDQWTVYDRFVARAMGVTKTDTTERMVEFYTTLQQRGFIDLAEQIQTVLDRTQLMQLHGTRVLDKFMMLRGAENSEPKWAATTRSGAMRFLALLPEIWRNELIELADEVTHSVKPSDASVSFGLHKPNEMRLSGKTP